MRMTMIVCVLSSSLMLPGRLPAVQTEKSVHSLPRVPLPEGVSAVWDVEKAFRWTTPTRERLCLNGLWLWQPADGSDHGVPTDRWGYFKVPGSWPGITDYMQKDCQTVYTHPGWKGRSLRGISGAWYQREIVVPTTWADRRITISAEYVNSHATLYLDDEEMGDIVFPGGQLDITAACRPGTTQILSLFVAAMPLKGVMLSYTDTASAREVKGAVARRGLCGDVYLASEPKQARIAAVKVDTSVRQWEITVGATLEGLAAHAPYVLKTTIMDGHSSVGEFTSKTFQASDLQAGRVTVTEHFRPEKLWDVHAPENTYTLHLSLVKAGGVVQDVREPVQFGFREFWIEGRDFFLNGSRLFLSSVPLDNAQVGAAWANYAAARKSMERLKSFGINFVYTHNYGCEPGSHLSFAEILRAADDTGMLVALSQPHFSHYDWDTPDADLTNGYARHAAFYVSVAGNHPSVVFYAMSHNATGYSEDMNPDMIDGIQAPRDSWALRNANRAVRAAAIVEGLDPGRIVYHHASGNLGPLHTSNFYANFAPIQEMSDWFGHWATAGVKPLFTCEYSVPFPWDWAMYRGWYQGERSFGSAKVPWEFCLAEWNAQFFGDQAFKISEMEERNLRWEAKKFREGSLWYRWDYPHALGSSAFSERQGVNAMYLTDNWRAFRTWGVSANSPWSYGHYWTLRAGVDKRRKDLNVDWETLQRPGFSPDYIDQRYERMDLAFEFSDWVPTLAAQALMRNNQPLLAYIAGKPGAFTSKDHNVLSGETLEKQLIVINNSRETVTCDLAWSLDLPRAIKGQKHVTVRTGQQQRVTLHFQLPSTLAPGTYTLNATFKFGNGETQTDSFLIHVMTPVPATRTDERIALFDPKGQSGTLLDRMGIAYQTVDANTSLSSYDILIVGKSALTVAGRSPDITRVRSGLKVLMFEQTSEVLEQRLGFRTAEYGLRRVFERVPDHPLLAGIQPQHLRDWRGKATILPAKLDYKPSPRYNGAPAVTWCGITVPRLWRCGNRGNVASVLIEKPARGDFMPILDGGYSLQYSPLMEFCEGEGMVLFCQMDVTGRTESDPSAETLARNILQYVSTWRPPPKRAVVFVGDSEGRQHLERSGLALKLYTPASLSEDSVLVVGPSGAKTLASDAAAIARWLKAGGHLLAIGFNGQQGNAFLPLEVHTEEAEHIAAYFDPPPVSSFLAGVGPADVHSREPQQLPLVLPGAAAIGQGVLAQASHANVVFCQLSPWQYDHNTQLNLRRTFRRSSSLLTRLLANMGAAGDTPLVERFCTPVDVSRGEARWLEGLYMDVPQAWDDPYRFFRW